MLLRKGRCLWRTDEWVSYFRSSEQRCPNDRVMYVYIGGKSTWLTRLGAGREGSYESIDNGVKKTKNSAKSPLLQLHGFRSFTYSSESWLLCKWNENAVSVVERSIEKVIQGVTRLTQLKQGNRSALLKRSTKLKSGEEHSRTKPSCGSSVLPQSELRRARVTLGRILAIEFNRLTFFCSFDKFSSDVRFAM